MSGKTSSASDTLKLMSFGPLLPLFGRKILALPCSYRFLTLAARMSLSGLAKRSTTMATYFRATIPRNSALLVVKATLKDLAAYSADFVPPEALDTLASYLLSWAATVALFDMLTAEQLPMAAASDEGAVQGILSRKQRGGDLTAATARQVLVQNVCRAITRAVQQAKEGLLISSIVQRFLLDLPLRLLVLLLGIPLLRSTATTRAPLLEASGKTSGKRASCTPWPRSIPRSICWDALLYRQRCHYRLTFWPSITSFAHFHPMRKPPQGSKPDGNVRFPPGTLLLLEVSFASPHGQGSAPRVQHLLEGPAAIEAIRGRHGFTFATTPLELPEGPWPRAASSTTDRQCVRSLDPESMVPGSCSTKASGLLRQALVTFRQLHQGCSPFWSTKPSAPNHNNVILQPDSGQGKPVMLPLATSLTRPSLKCLPERRSFQCLRSPSMHLGGGKPPCITSRSMCTTLCVLGTLRPLWYGAACSIRLLQGSL